jgi:hypothetical protein
MDYKVYVKGSYLEIEEIQGSLKFSVLQKDVTVLQHDTDKNRFYFHNVPNFDKLVNIENIKQENLSDFTVQDFIDFYTALGSNGGSGGTGGTTIDRELVVTTYFVKTAFTGASVGDTITCTQIIDVTASPINVSTIWRNQTTAANLASAPSAANLTLLGSQALTDAQLRAAAVDVSNANLVNIDANLGAKNDAVATTDDGTFSVIAFIKRGLQNWTTLLSRLPTLGQKNAGGSVPVVIASDQAAVAVAPNVTRGGGAIDSNTQRVTLATDGPGVVSLSSIDNKTPALDNNRQPVIPSMVSGGNISVQTATTGTNYTAFASQVCKQLTISNQSGTVVEVRQGAAGVALQIPTGAFYTFFGITNTNQLDVRRTDVSNTQITLTARWEA